MGVYSYQTKAGIRYWYKVKSHGVLLFKKGFLTQSDAQAAMRKALRLRAKGRFAACPRVSTLCRAFLDSYALSYKESTVYKMRHAVGKYVIGLFPDVPIGLLTEEDFSRWRKAVQDCPNQDKNFLLSVLRRVFGFARDHYPYKDKFDLFLPLFRDYAIKAPFQPQKKERFLTPDEFIRFLKAVKEPSLRLMFLLAFVTGIRIGEARGLTPRAFKDGKMAIFRQVSKTCPDRFVSPKTASSNRVYDLPPSLWNKIQTWIQGNRLKDDDFVFFSFLGFPFVPVGESTIRREILMACKISGVKPFSFHAFRHSDATYLHGEGIRTLDIAKYLGQSDSSVTERVYIGQTDESKKAIQSVWDAFLYGLI